MVRHRNSLLIVLAFASVAWAHPTPVDFGGELARWNIDASSAPITWSIDTELTQSLPFFEYVVESSANIWMGVDNSYLRLAKASTDQTPQITIVYSDSIQGGDSAAGYAEFDESDSDGPVHCSVHIAAPTTDDWSNLAKTTLHELGHCLGLGHSLVAESIMSYELEKNSFGLALDDEAAVARLYPKNQSKPKLPPGCAIGSKANPREEGLVWILLFTVMPLLSLRLLDPLLIFLASKR